MGEKAQLEAGLTYLASMSISVSSESSCFTIAMGAAMLVSLVSLWGKRGDGVMYASEAKGYNSVIFLSENCFSSRTWGGSKQSHPRIS